VAVTGGVTLVNRCGEDSYRRARKIGLDEQDLVKRGFQVCRLHDLLCIYAGYRHGQRSFLLDCFATKELTGRTGGSKSSGRPADDLVGSGIPPGVNVFTSMNEQRVWDLERCGNWSASKTARSNDRRNHSTRSYRQSASAVVVKGNALALSRRAGRRSAMDFVSMRADSAGAGWRPITKSRAAALTPQAICARGAPVPSTKAR